MLWAALAAQATFIHQVIKVIEKKKEETQVVQCGWFTPEQMRTVLKWSPPLISILVVVQNFHSRHAGDRTFL